MLLALTAVLAMNYEAAATTAPEDLSGIGVLVQGIADADIGATFCVSGVVTMCSAVPGGAFFLQDDTHAARLFNHSTEGIRPGDAIVAFGRINRGMASGRPAADVVRINVLAHDCLPPPLSIEPKRLSDPAMMHRIVRIAGRIQDAFRDELDRDWFFFVLNCKNTIVYISCRQPVDAEQLEALIGSEVSVAGICMGRLHNNRRMIMRTVELMKMEDLHVLKPKPSTTHEPSDIDSVPFLEGLPETDIGVYSASGRVLAAWGNGNVLLRTSTGTLVKGEITKPPFPSYDEAIRLLGRPETDLYNPILVHASWLPATDAPKATPEAEIRDVTVDTLHACDPTYRHYDFSFHGRTVRLRGVVRGLPALNGDGRISLECGSRIVTVDISTIPSAGHGLEAGYGVEVTGVCVMQAEKMSLNWTIPRISGFIIVPRTPADIRIVSRPPWWTPLRLLIVICFLLAILAGTTAWNVALRRIAEKRAHQLADEEISHVKSELKASERTRLAVEIHDTLSQNITGACLKVNAAEHLLGEDPEAAAAHLAVAARTLASCRNEIRNCLCDLRSQVLEEEVMDNAIRKTLEPLMTDDVEISIRFAVPRVIFADNTAHALLCVVRELVHNAIRHGHATSVRIAGCAERGSIVFSVRDNGCGFDPKNAPDASLGHFGLQGVHERMKAIGGEVEIKSERGIGTRVRITIPLPAEKGGKI